MTARELLVPLLLLIVHVGCSPQQSLRDFGGREKFAEFGPQSDEALPLQNFSQELTDWQKFSASLRSQQIFYTSADIQESLLLVRRQWEKKAHSLSYQIQQELFEIEKLEAFLANPPKDFPVSSLEAMREILRRLRWQDAFDLASFRRRIQDFFSKGEFKNPIRSQAPTSEETQCVELMQALSRSRFLYGSIKERQRSMLALLSPVFARHKFYIPVVDFLLAPAPEYTELDRELLFKANRLHEQFYKNPHNSLRFAVEESSYIEAALGRYGGDIYQIWTRSFLRIKKQIQRAFSRIRLVIPVPEKEEEWLQPHLVVDNLLEQMRGLGDALRAEAVDEVAVVQVDKQLQELYPTIEFSRQQLAEMGLQDVSKNMRLLDSVLERLDQTPLFPPTVMQAVRQETLFPQDIRRQMDVIRDERSSEKLRVAIGQTILIKLWRYVKSEVEEEFNELLQQAAAAGCPISLEKLQSGDPELEKLPAHCANYEPFRSAYKRWAFKIDRLAEVFGSEALVVALYSLKDADLDYLSRVHADQTDLVGEPWWSIPVLASIEAMIQLYLGGSGLSDFLAIVNTAVNRVLLQKLSLRLADELANFGGIIEKQIHAALAKNDLNSLEFYYRLKEIADVEIRNKLLLPGHSEDFFLYEAAKVETKYESGQWQFFPFRASAGYFLTGSEALLSSISSRVLTFWTSQDLASDQQVSLLENTSSERKAFELLNKSLGLLGTQDYFGRQSPTLITNQKATLPARLDIYTYAHESQVFGVPDIAWLEPDKKYFELALLEEGRNFSVAGQAALMQAGTHLMELFADYEESALDDTLHGIQYQGAGFFPKESLADMGLGLASVVLRNLYKEGLMLFDRHRQPLVVTDANRGDIASQVTSAALVPIQKGQSTKVVPIAEMARYMLALADFLEALERAGFSRSTTMLYRNPENGSAVLDELYQAADLLRKLYIAMANFITTRVRRPDMLFADHYDLASQQAATNASLETQLLVGRALLKANQIWGAEIYLWATLDMYQQLNRQRLSPAGHYRDPQVWPPYLLGLSLRFLSELEQASGVENYLSAPARQFLRRLREQQHQHLLKVL